MALLLPRLNKMESFSSGIHVGRQMHDLARELFPICRSITGEGVRATLRTLQRELPDLAIHSVPSGTQAFDWMVPREWNIRSAYLQGPDGQRIVDFKDSNLHVVGYSTPVDCTLTLNELEEHLHSLPDQPDAIPYVTSYYKETWGFCLAHCVREQLEPGLYRAVIDSALTTGELNYGELILPGDTSEEVFLSTYICHPSLANNELSGPVVTTFLARWLKSLPRRRYTYRFVFIPETIGSIVYISRHLAHLKAHTMAGFNVTCVGDDRSYSYLPSRNGGTLADRVALHVLRNHAPGFVSYSFLDRGSDERQYCSPGVDLPIASVMRTKYLAYPEYHTSKDDLTLVTPSGLAGGYEVLRRCLICLERNEILYVPLLCEPHLSKRNLYPTLSTKDVAVRMAPMMDILAYADGTVDLIGVADAIGKPLWELLDIIDDLKRHQLLVSVR